jgi:hypothetical protein
MSRVSGCATGRRPAAGHDRGTLYEAVNLQASSRPLSYINELKRHSVIGHHGARPFRGPGEALPLSPRKAPVMSKSQDEHRIFSRQSSSSGFRKRTIFHVLEILNHEDVEDTGIPTFTPSCQGHSPHLCSKDPYRLTNDFFELD